MASSRARLSLNRIATATAEEMVQEYGPANRGQFTTNQASLCRRGASDDFVW